MFTGIIEAQGTITQSTPLEKGQRLHIASAGLDLADVKIGDSIAVNGCCLTVVNFGGGGFEVDVSRETLDCTAGLALGSDVNLEKALRLSDRLGGHLVTGHVDGAGEVTRFERLGESWLLEVRAPKDLAKYIARKGSITVNGVSLTVNHVDEDHFDVNLIPHTVEVTNLKELKVGVLVNLEIDLIARYVERLAATD
ncbi:MAG: riboflavin synthase [Betaproteobacteria bacterium]|nr:riboflavin synthase [Betaproteobacteria bacterium]